MFACCDESGIHPKSRWWVIGAMWLPDDQRLPAYEAAATELRQRTNVDGSDGRIEAVVRNEAWTSVAVELPSGDLLPIPVLRPLPLGTGEVEAAQASQGALNPA
jgi:hypothetical protein